MKRVVVAIVGILIVFVDVGTIRATELSVQQILFRVAQVYSGIRDYQFEATEETTETSVRGTFHAKSRITLQVSAPARVRLAVEGSRNDLLIVSDGQTMFWYLPAQRVYTRESAGPVVTTSNQDIGGDALTAAEHTLVNRYKTIHRFASLATLDRKERVKVGGKDVDCYSVNLHLSGGNTHKVWIDVDRFLVLRDWDQSSSKASGVPALTSTRVELTQAVLEAPPAESFLFTPPDGAREVQALAIQGGRGRLAGKSAVDFSLNDTQGTKVTLGDFQGKVVLLDFWATWCEPCRRELPRIAKLFSQSRDKGLVILGINSEDPGTIRTFLEKQNISVPTLVDSDQSVHEKYGIRAVPTEVIIGRNGVVTAYYVGGTTDEELSAALKAAGL